MLAGGPPVGVLLLHDRAADLGALALRSGTPGPRFAVLSFNAPHLPFHVPPAELTGELPTTTDREQYLAMITALDTELGRAMQCVDESSTYVLFVSDNGTPSGRLPPARKSA